MSFKPKLNKARNLRDLGATVFVPARLAITHVLAEYDSYFLT
jgi:hypothetical protein